MDWNLPRRLVEEDQAMQMTLNATEWDELEQAQQHEHGVRNGKRYQAIRLLEQGQTPLEVAAALGCRKSSVYNWIAGCQPARWWSLATGATLRSTCLTPCGPSQR